jgi:protein TonB
MSALIHGGILGLAPVKARPADQFLEQGPHTALVDISLPAPPRQASPPRPAPSETPAPAVPEAPAENPPETAPEYDGPVEEQAQGETGGPVAAAAVDPALRENAVGRYLAMIRGLIDRRKEYPYQARRQEQEGTVVVRFTLTRQGLLAGEPLPEKRSRHERLNAAAVEAVKNAAPYPPFPPEITGSEMSLQVAVTFSLR